MIAARYLAISSGRRRAGSEAVPTGEAARAAKGFSTMSVELGNADMEPKTTGSLSEAIAPSALRAALVPRRPVFANPWDSPPDMFACVVAVGVVIPLLLWGGGALVSSIFGFGSRWSLGVYIAAALVGAAGFMTIAGRVRSRLSVDILAITAWLLLGLVVAPVLGLAPPRGAAIASYGVLLLAILAYVLLLGRWQTAFIRTVTWPMTWSLLAAFFAFCAYRLLLYP
jgi:hypothetical protein